MADIFISHSTLDKDLANYLCDAFEYNIVEGYAVITGYTGTDTGL